MYKKITHLLILASLVSIIGCGGNNTSKQQSSEPTATYVCPMRCKNSTAHRPGNCPVCHMLLVKSIELDSMNTANKATNQSIYEGDYLWTNQNGQKIGLSEAVGNYQLVSTIFTNCEYACPNLISDMLNIDDAIDEDKKNKLNFILISIDPERDTPSRLLSYSKDMSLDNDRWQLLNGTVGAIDAMAMKLGVSYKKFENGAFGHSNVISLLNQGGEIIYQLEGIHADKTALVDLINSL